MCSPCLGLCSLFALCCAQRTQPAPSSPPLPPSRCNPVKGDPALLAFLRCLQGFGLAKREPWQGRQHTQILLIPDANPAGFLLSIPHLFSSLSLLRAPRRSWVLLGDMEQQAHPWGASSVPLAAGSGLCGVSCCLLVSQSLLVSQHFHSPSLCMLLPKPALMGR